MRALLTKRLHLQPIPPDVLVQLVAIQSAEHKVFADLFYVPATQTSGCLIMTWISDTPFLAL